MVLCKVIKMWHNPPRMIEENSFFKFVISQRKEVEIIDKFNNFFLKKDLSYMPEFVN